MLLNVYKIVMLTVLIALGAVVVIGLIPTPALAKINIVCHTSGCHNENYAGNRPPGQNK
jgi:hypothetical protein